MIKELIQSQDTTPHGVLLRSIGKVEEILFPPEEPAEDANPAKWVWDEFHYELSAEQTELMQAVDNGEDTLGSTGHSCGKSFALACCVIRWLDRKEHSKVLTTAPGERQLKFILWAEIKGLFKRWSKRKQWRITDGMHLYNLTSPDDWYALGVFAADADRMEGFHTKVAGNLLIVVDEAKGVEDEFFTAIATMGGQRLIASVPPVGGTGYFVDQLTKHRDLWHMIHMDSTKSRFVAPGWLAQRKIDWIEGSPIWIAKVQGQLPVTDATDLVVNPGWVDAAQNRWETANLEEWENSAIGLDVARFGDDRTTLCLQRDCMLARVRELVKRDLMQIVGVAREMCEEESRAHAAHGRELGPKEIPIWVDDTGVGGGVTDRLAELDYNVVGIQFGSKANNAELYANRRTELWFELADEMQKFTLPPDGEFNGAGARLAAELCMPKFKYLSTGKILEPKEQIKKRLGRSPDIGDALALSNAALLEAAAGCGWRCGNHARETDYVPEGAGSGVPASARGASCDRVRRGRVGTAFDLTRGQRIVLPRRRRPGAVAGGNGRAKGVEARQGSEGACDFCVIAG